MKLKRFVSVSTAEGTYSIVFSPSLSESYSKVEVTYGYEIRNPEIEHEGHELY